MRAPYKVSLVAANGKTWTLAVAESRDEANQRRSAALKRISGIGFREWAREVAVPERFLPS